MNKFRTHTCGELTKKFVKNFSDSQIILDKKLINFICKRIARSYDKISEFICTIDEISLKKKTPINLKIIKEILGVSN